MRIAILAFVLALQSAAGQQPDPVRAARPSKGIEKLLVLPEAPRPRRSITGIVIAADTGLPIPNATILLTRTQGLASIIAIMEDRPSPGPVDPTTTDDAGRFVFLNLEADSYRLNVAKSGYVLQDGEPAESDNPSTLVSLYPDRDIDELKLRVARKGSVGGHIRDLSGQPVRGVPVQLLRRLSSLTLKIVAENRSDDSGAYRLEELVPGEYILAAGAAIVVTPLSETLNTPEGEYGFTFYPGTSSADHAARLAVGGDEVPADFSLSPEKRRRIRGSVVEQSTGAPPIAVTGSLASTTPTGIARKVSSGDELLFRYEPRDGTFEVSDLLPGTYTITIMSRSSSISDGESIGGRISVTVNDSDIEGEVVTLVPSGGKPSAK